MIDIFIGKPPDVNRHHDQPEAPVQQEIRELVQIVQNLPKDRRRNTRDRRRQNDPDVIVDLSTRRERRTRVDRRQKQEFVLPSGQQRERRSKYPDRRHLQNEGIVVSLSSRQERRRSHDRRSQSGDTRNPTGAAQANPDEIRATLDSIRVLARKLRSLL